MWDQFICSSLIVFATFSVMFLVTLSKVFDDVELDIGLEHYAEIPWLSPWQLMPLNTLVNIGYIGLGLYWCAFTQTASCHGVLKTYDVYFFYVFNIMSSLYGCIQTARIITQEVIWSVLDQWCTLPFFAILLIWGLYYHSGWSYLRFFIIIFASISSYSLTLIHVRGFEFCLGCHVICAVVGGLLAYSKYPAKGSLFYFYAALVSCSGFVILKLLDMKLASLCFIFRYVSGHFLSKICDVYQIHFVNAFFIDITLEKSVDLSVRDKLDWISKQEEIRTLKGRDIPYKNPVSWKTKKS